jgi:beta-mannosidase
LKSIKNKFSLLWLVFAFCFLLAACSDKFISPVNTFKLNVDWKFARSGDDKWFTADIPGSVQLDLFHHNLIPDPEKAINEQSLQWIAESDWQYVAHLNVSDSLLNYKAVDLIFEDIDTYSRIELNDSLLLETSNMFRKFTVNAKPLLKQGINSIRILLYSPVREGEKELKKLSYQLPSNESTELKVSPFIRKAPYQFGWDFAPRIITMGVGHPVTVRAHDGLHLAGVHIKTIEIADTCAWLQADVTVTSAISNATVIVTIADSWKQVKLKKGDNIVPVKFKINNPELWWPNGMGNHKLYDITARLYFNNYLVDTNITRTGIRTIELLQEEDVAGESFYFSVNGIPFFAMGANYVPQSAFPTTVPDENYRRLIADAASANMNMLRVWGGGIYEKDIFYDLCDEYGILVWQDFMFSCSMLPGDSSFLNNVRLEVDYQVKRLRNHPSIALWCGNNEIDVAWHNWGWQKQYNYKAADSLQIWNNYKNLFNDVIPKVVEMNDPGKNYISSSPVSNWGSHKNFRYGDMHYWGVWHGEESVDSFRVFVPRFMSEYGMQSFPSYRTILMEADSAVSVQSPVINLMQKSYKGNNLLLKYIAESYGPVKNTMQLSYLSQLLQARSLEIAIGSHRKNSRFCMGSLYWQLNDTWNCASWSTIEHSGKWKASMYKIRKLYSENVLICENEKNNTGVYLQSCNFKNGGIAGKLVVVVNDFKGRQVAIYNRNVSASYLDAVKILDLPDSAIFKNFRKTELYLHAKLFTDEKVITEEIFYFTAPKNLKLPQPKVEYELLSYSADTVEVVLHAAMLVKDLFLQLKNSDSKFSDNYFDLLPGQKKSVFVKRPENDVTKEDIILQWYQLN